MKKALLFFTLLASLSNAQTNTSGKRVDERQFIRESQAGDYCEQWLAAFEKSSRQGETFTILIDTQAGAMKVPGIYHMERSPDYSQNGETVRGNLLIAIAREGKADTIKIVDPRKILMIQKEP